MKQLLVTIAMMAATTAWWPSGSGINLLHHISGRQVNDSAKLAGDWYLQPVLASDTATGKLPVLKLDLSGRKFAGFTGCNQMNGGFRLQSDMIQFNENISLTKMECEGYNEKEFLVNLLRVDHYKIKDGVLWLMIGQTPVSRWMRKPEARQTV